ncbi:YveK family protein [Bifidobacterium canis]|uniref:YveK family protein n=1 Tax=Bifidobacterium canis TaxID=2610880 RepID=UPI001FE7E00D|nr:hypothetical protein [Bifidobacterium canis]
MSQIKSYPTLATTQSVLQPVIDELNLNISVSALASEISVVNPENTAFVNISVTSTDGKQAAEIANAVARSLSNVVEKSLYTNDARSTVKLSIVQPATVPNAPSSPNWKMNIFVGVIVGLFIGIMAALLKDVLSTTIQDDNDVREYIDAPTIGRIPEDELLEGSSPMVISEPGSPIAEDFRRVRTNLSFIAPVSETSCRLIVVTSTGESEGKQLCPVTLLPL